MENEENLEGAVGGEDPQGPENRLAGEEDVMELLRVWELVEW